jgi:DNA-binding NtrC family response regulator
LTSRILVVDDEVDILSSVRTFLEEDLGVEVVAAFSGEQGLAALRDGDIDVVMSDYRMPVMDGLEFLRQAKAMAPDVPRVLLTAYPDIQLAADALNQARISQFLSKPVQPRRLAEVMKALVGERNRSAQTHAAFGRATGAHGPRPDRR